MADQRHRQTHTCPRCAHIFKNFKWEHCWKYDGACARCPNCDLEAHEWPKEVEKKQ